MSPELPVRGNGWWAPSAAAMPVFARVLGWPMLRDLSMISLVVGATGIRLEK